MSNIGSSSSNKQIHLEGGGGAVFQIEMGAKAR